MEGGRRVDGVPADAVARSVMWRWICVPPDERGSRSARRHISGYATQDLKKGKIKPEYAGKLNFYCNVINDKLKHPGDAPTIGLILCQSHDKLLAEYSFAGIDKPIGISTYELTRALPENVQSALPTVEQIEAELQRLEAPPPPAPKPKRAAGRKKKDGGE